MAATTPKSAESEGRAFGILLRKVFVLNPDLNFRTAQEFSQAFAELVGYRDMRIGIPFIQAMIEVLISKESPDELKAKYAAGIISLDAFQKAIQKAIQAPEDD